MVPAHLRYPAKDRKLVVFVCKNIKSVLLSAAQMIVKCVVRVLVPAH